MTKASSYSTHIAQGQISLGQINSPQKQNYTNILQELK